MSWGHDYDGHGGHASGCRMCRIGALAADLRAARELIQQFRGWDMLDACADGPFWKQKIDDLLSRLPGGAMKD